jgi:hypothetical protein
VPHVPDGVLIGPDGRRVAVELECSATGSARYHAVLRSYASSMAYDRARWFVADRHLHERIATVARTERLDDLVSVEAPPARAGARHSALKR